MTFLAPGFFFASVAVAAAVIVLHFIVTRQPRAGILPTARFVPDLPANSTARATRPSDLLLLLLRTLIVLAAGAGLAKPVVKPSRGAEARVILMDVSRSVRDSSVLRDSARTLYRDRDALVVFDSSARMISGNRTDSIESIPFSGARGNLSAALVAAMRAGSGLRDHADSIELVIVSPFAAEEMDAATDSIRSLWKGRARLVNVRSTLPDDAPSSSLEIRSAASDPLQITVGQARNDPRATALIVRSARFDSSDASDRALVQWPVAERPRYTVAKAVTDTIGGVIAGDALTIFAFERRWRFPPDSIRGSEVIARWIDGEPAAIETPTGKGCSRSVAIPVAQAGDLVIRRDFVRLVAALSGDCVSRAAMHPAEEHVLSRLSESGRLAAREDFQSRGDVRSELAPWLLGLGLAGAIAELFVRRRRVSEPASIGRSGMTDKRAA